MKLFLPNKRLILFAFAMFAVWLFSSGTANAELAVKVRLRVVIDPGHGGGDQGLSGPGGTKESDLTLIVAERFKQALETELGLEVFLTRQADQNPALTDRTALANAILADAFISIHCSMDQGKAPRYKVYIQDYKHQAGLAKQAESLTANPVTGDAWALTQARHLPASRRLAREIDLALSSILHVKERGVIGLPLAVLAGADQPAVLFEIGHLNDPESERRLTNPAYQDALSRAVVTAFSAWIKALQFADEAEGEAETRP
jgi:N-acetylmuramoyl-L-alanine amidase